LNKCRRSGLDLFPFSLSAAFPCFLLTTELKVVNRRFCLFFLLSFRTLPPLFSFIFRAGARTAPSFFSQVFSFFFFFLKTRHRATSLAGSRRLFFFSSTYSWEDDAYINLLNLELALFFSSFSFSSSLLSFFFPFFFFFSSLHGVM